MVIRKDIAQILKDVGYKLEREPNNLVIIAEVKGKLKDILEVLE
ncbi:MAG: hypothetical protein ACRCXT_00830 [Paraclostridium sp.]